MHGSCKKSLSKALVADSFVSEKLPSMYGYNGHQLIQNTWIQTSKITGWSASRSWSWKAVARALSNSLPGNHRGSKIALSYAIYSDWKTRNTIKTDYAIEETRDKENWPSAKVGWQRRDGGEVWDLKVRQSLRPRSCHWKACTPETISELLPFRWTSCQWRHSKMSSKMTKGHAGETSQLDDIWNSFCPVILPRGKGFKRLRSEASVSYKTLSYNDTTLSSSLQLDGISTGFNKTSRRLWRFCAEDSQTKFALLMCPTIGMIIWNIWTPHRAIVGWESWCSLKLTITQCMIEDQDLRRPCGLSQQLIHQGIVCRLHLKASKAVKSACSSAYKDTNILACKNVHGSC